MSTVGAAGAGGASALPIGTSAGNYYAAQSSGTSNEADTIGNNQGHVLMLGAKLKF